MKSETVESRPLGLFGRLPRTGCIFLTLLVLGLPEFSRPAYSDQPSGPQRPAVAERRTKDRYGDPLPAFAVARLGTVRLRHDETVRGVAFSPDAKKVAAVADDVCLWSVADGRLLRRLDLSHDPSLHEALAWLLLIRPGGETIPAFAPDGNVLAVPCESKVLVWNLTGKGKARSLGEKDCAICGCVYSPDGKLLAWGSIDIPKGRSQTIVVCEAASGKVVRKIDVHARIERLRGSPKDNLVAAVLIDDTVEVWDIAKGTRVCVLTNPDEPIHFVAFSPDGEKLATGSKNGHFSVWSVRSGKRLLDIPFVLPSAQSVILDMAFVPSGKRLAAVVLDGDPNAPELVTWNATTGQRVEKTRLAWPCYSLVFSPDGKWVASPTGVTVALRRFPDGTDPLDIQGHVFSVPFVAFLPRGSLVSWGPEGRTFLWDVRTAKPIWELCNYDRYYPTVSGPQAVAVFPRRNLLAVAFRGRAIEVWNMAERKREKTLQVAKGQLLSALQFSPDGNSLACGDLQGNLWILDVQSGHTVRKWSRADLMGEGGGKALAAEASPFGRGLPHQRTRR